VKGVILSKQLLKTTPFAWHLSQPDACSHRLFVKTKVEQKAIALRTGDLDLASLLQHHTDSLM
jgi:hypothetical protein